MTHPAHKPRGSAFSSAEYPSWPDDERWEMYRGRPVRTVPALNRLHRAMVRGLGLQIGSFLLYLAPLDTKSIARVGADAAGKGLCVRVKGNNVPPEGGRAVLASRNAIKEELSCAQGKLSAVSLGYPS